MLRLPDFSELNFLLEGLSFIFFGVLVCLLPLFRLHLLIGWVLPLLLVFIVRALVAEDYEKGMVESHKEGPNLERPNP